jgi:hypothetical protein
MFPADYDDGDDDLLESGADSFEAHDPMHGPLRQGFPWEVAADADANGIFATQTVCEQTPPIHPSQGAGTVRPRPMPHEVERTPQAGALPATVELATRSPAP